LFVSTMEHLEFVQNEFARIFKTDLASNNFNRKKELTSAFRRCAPLGLATSITFSGNIRALRHVIAQRTSDGAEAEIRVIFKRVAEICLAEYPNFFSDMTIDANGVCSFANYKV
jgi:thymidylate synthase (FAD)